MPSGLSPTCGSDSWVHALKDYISRVEDDFFEQVDDGADGCENLNSPQNLGSSIVRVTKFLIRISAKILSSSTWYREVDLHASAGALKTRLQILVRAGHRPDSFLSLLSCSNILSPRVPERRESFRPLLSSYDPASNTKHEACLTFPHGPLI
ncbi:hypothetical protein M9H77_05488 [Catharanthus roseus]|uniref:Uncharacterized protein n=1 Tax=Catharanthus roseus TaxID=4058 RepID=A0ACC0CH38_CATRO|nr:hypothetical protein M9H77_05488 [Catharanthus roseus]